MFTGMMHDFRIVGFSQEEIDKQLIERGEEFEADVSTALPERKLAFVLSALIAAYCLFTAPRGTCFGSRLGVTLVVCAVVWLLSSISWSVSPGETARELVRVVVYLALCVGLVKKFAPLELVMMLMVVSVLSIATAVWYEVFVGSYEFVDEVYRLNGSMHPNSLSRFSVYIAVPAAAFMVLSTKHRLSWGVLLLVSFVIIQLTACRTSLGSALAGIVAMAVVYLGARRFVVPAFAGVAALGLLLMLIGIGGQSAQDSAGGAIAMGRTESVSSMTGRLPLWGALIERVSDRPLVGFGYGAFWDTRMIASVHRQIGWYAGHSHNCYMELLVNLGVIGLAIFICLGVHSLRRCVDLTQSTRELAYPILGGLLAASFVNGITEVGCVLPREHAIFTGIYVLAALRLPTHEYRIADDRGTS
jgi:O-antigen ligase